jgi:hypothetical protein
VTTIIPQRPRISIQPIPLGNAQPQVIDNCELKGIRKIRAVLRSTMRNSYAFNKTLLENNLSLGIALAETFVSNALAAAPMQSVSSPSIDC